MRHTIWITSFLLLICLPASPNRFKHISTHNGLSSKRTFSIVKDSRGFIWISTRLGIDRYDGKSIRQYALADETGDRDMTSRINTLSGDKSGNIWAFTNYGQIFRYDILSDSYVLESNLADSASFPNPFLNGIRFIDGDNMLVYGSFGVWQDGIVEKPIRSIGFNERVQAMHYDKFNASLLPGTFTGKLLLYDILSGRLKKLDFDFRESIRDVKCYNNTLYIATDGAGLITMNNDTKKEEQL